MKTVFHWNPFVIFNHRITLEEVWLMQFKFSPDKLNYSSWWCLRQKTKAEQSVSQSSAPGATHKKGKPHLAPPQVEVLLLASTAPRRAQDLVLVPTATPTFCFPKQGRNLGRPTDKKCCGLQGRWQKQSWGLYLHLERAVCSVLMALTGRTKESEELFISNWMKTSPVASHYFICQWWVPRELPEVVSGELLVRY